MKYNLFVYLISLICLKHDQVKVISSNQHQKLYDHSGNHFPKIQNISKEHVVLQKGDKEGAYSDVSSEQRQESLHQVKAVTNNPLIKTLAEFESKKVPSPVQPSVALSKLMHGLRATRNGSINMPAIREHIGLQLKRRLGDSSIVLNEIGNIVSSPNDGFGWAVSLSGDGRLLAVGAPYDDSNGLTGNGRVRVYKINDGAFTQFSEDIVGNANNNYFGRDVALSKDGTFLAVGALSGYVRLFQVTNESLVKIGNDIVGEYGFGHTISLSADGTVLAVANPSSPPGFVRLYKVNKNNGAVTQIGGDIEHDGEGAAIVSKGGEWLSLSANGNMLAVGHATSTGNGLLTLYKINSVGWVKMGGNILGGTNENFGQSGMSFSEDGSIIAVGAPLQSFVRVYEIINDALTQVGSDIIGEGSSHSFGFDTSLSANGSILAVIAPHSGGYTSLYKLNSGAWTKIGGTIYGKKSTDEPFSVSLSTDGSLFAVGTYNNPDGGTAALYELNYSSNSPSLSPRPSLSPPPSLSVSHSPSLSLPPSYADDLKFNTLIVNATNMENVIIQYKVSKQMSKDQMSDTIKDQNCINDATGTPALDIVERNIVQNSDKPFNYYNLHLKLDGSKFTQSTMYTSIDAATGKLEFCMLMEEYATSQKTLSVSFVKTNIRLNFHLLSVVDFSIEEDVNLENYAVENFEKDMNVGVEACICKVLAADSFECITNPTLKANALLKICIRPTDNSYAPNGVNELLFSQDSIRYEAITSGVNNAITDVVTSATHLIVTTKMVSAFYVNDPPNPVTITGKVHFDYSVGRMLLEGDDLDEVGFEISVNLTK